MVQDAPAVEKDIESSIYDSDAEGPPELFSIDAERSLLGAILIDPGALPEISLEMEDFHDLRHKLVWRAISTVFKETGSGDISTVADHLERDNKLGEVGGVGYLTQLTISTSFNIVGNERIIREYSRRREALEIFQSGARSAIISADDLDLDWVTRLSKLKIGSQQSLGWLF
jgi:replicative DNA helicase